MDTPLQHERRSRQRFPFQIPVTLRVDGSASEEPAFTQDLSARGAFLYTDCRVAVGAVVELTLRMPSEITLADSMRVRCRGKVLRIVHRDAVKNKMGLAVEWCAYEYLSEKSDETQNRTDFDRISPLHEHPFGEESPASPIRRN
jgi:hypothetical protein